MAFFGNLTDAIAHNANRRPDHPALIDGGRTLDYQALDRAIRQTANHLAGLGLAEGDTVGVSMGDTIDHLIAMLGVIRLGAILLPMDCRWTVDEGQRVTSFFGAKACLVDDADSIFPETKTHIVVEPWHEAVAASSAEGRFPSDPDAPVWVSLSSGTTGVPKGPILTHRQMALRFLSQCVTMGFSQVDRYISATPLYFGGGRGFTVSYLTLGGTVVMYPPPYLPEELVQAVADHGITTLFLVPTLLRRLLDLPSSEGSMFPSLRLLISSGSLLYPEERARILSDLCPNFVNIYSSTEGGAISILLPETPDAHVGSVGRAAYGTEFEVVDEADKPVGSGEVGLIRHLSPWLPDGFHRNPEETAKSFRDGWYYPGDLGRIDEAGYLYVVGRAKDMIIRGGVNIYPADIEETLLRHPKVHDAAVVGWPSREFGEEVAAFVIADGSVPPEELKELCRDSLARYKIPREVFMVDEFPKNAMGKVLKQELVNRLPTMDR